MAIETEKILCENCIYLQRGSYLPMDEGDIGESYAYCSHGHCYQRTYELNPLNGRDHVKDIIRINDYKSKNATLSCTDFAGTRKYKRNKNREARKRK